MRGHRFSPLVDGLEPRELLAASIRLSNGVLQITGDSSPNDAVARVSLGRVEVSLTYIPFGFFLVDPGPTTIRNSFPASSVREIRFEGLSGNDTLTSRVDLKTTALGGPGNDVLTTGGGDDLLDGGDGVDTLDAGAGRNRVDGGTGNDWAQGRVGDTFVNAESVVLTGVPGGNKQESNKCGPNSAWRVMNAQGGTASVREITDRASEKSLVSKWNLGTTGSTLVDAMNGLRRGLSGRPSFSLKTKSSLEDLLAAVASGRPAVTMIKVAGTETFRTGIVSYTVPRLHWIAVDGFDRGRRLVYYTDTDGGRYTTSFDRFDGLFQWDFGRLQNAALQSLGVVKGTFIV